MQNKFSFDRDLLRKSDVARKIPGADEVSYKLL